MSAGAAGLGLWIPGETHDEEYDDGSELAVEIAYIGEYRRYLKDIDVNLDIVRVKSGAGGFPETVWGYFVIIRRNPLGERMFSGMWTVCNEDGSMCLPDERHLQALRARDRAANPRVWAAHQKAIDDERKSKDRAKDRRREDFRELMTERLNSHLDATIFVSSDMKDKAAVGVSGDAG